MRRAAKVLACIFASFHLSMALSPDGVALLAMKSHIVDESGVLDDWEEVSLNPCNWTGVSCDEWMNVISLNLSHMNLSGTVSGVVGSLRHLTSLSLDSNNFTGAVPEGLSLLTHLRIFNITNNLFVSRFPDGFANLTKLRILDCYNNNMSGPLPLQIAQLRNLEKVHLGGNYYTGSIPPEYGNFSGSLKYLSLSGNDLTGSIPPQLGRLTGLTHLYLGYYNVFDSIPPELGELSSLQLLDLASCGVKGSIPKELARLKKLESMFLYGNKLGGSIPPELGSLANLRSMDLSSNELTGPIPETFAGLTNITLLSFFRNYLDGEVPASLGDLPALEVLNLWENNLTGQLPQRLGRSGRLLYLDVSTNKLSGPLPDELCLGGKLGTLIVMDNRLSGPIPQGVGECTSLEYIRLQNNFLNGTIPPLFFNLHGLTMLQLDNNHFTGPLPPTVNAPLLRVLELTGNRLVGTIPESVGDLVALQTLELGANQLTGYIPASLSRVPGLTIIDLSFNFLLGTIPSPLANCSLLSKLDLSNNNLVGEIPPEFVSLPVLAILNLSRNLLTGPIPGKLGDIQTLTQVDFSYNNFSGPIPTLGEAEYYDAGAYSGNPLLCGGVLRPCGADGLPAGNSSIFRSSSKKGPNLLAWLVGAIFAAALLVLLVGMCCFFRRYRYYVLEMFRKKGKPRPWKLTTFQRLDFTANELVECLTDENIIGRGGAGTVYKGELANGDMVAVKKLACGRGKSSHDHGFSAEIRTLGKIRHRNIVRLLGFCTNNEINLLVYEFMPNGSLGEFLHGKKSGLLDWKTRFKIAVQAANGLCYLHHDCSPLIVHRDVKSNNILLDSDLEAHVADFGLAKLFQDSGKSESMSSIAGSYGYIAPEYAYTLKVNEKSDIYSFGVVLMELLTGKRPIEPEFGDGVDIVQWVRTKIQTKEGLMEIVDTRLGALTVQLQEVMLVLRVALLCSSDHPIDRPTMRDVVQMLTDLKPSSAGMDSELKLHMDLLTEAF